MTKSSSESHKVTNLHTPAPGETRAYGKTPADPASGQQAETAEADAGSADRISADPVVVAPRDSAAGAVLRRLTSSFHSGAMSRSSISPARPPAGADRVASLPRQVSGSGAAPAVTQPAIGAPAVSPVAAPPKAAGQDILTRPVAGSAELRPRHRGILISFLSLVALPVVVSAAYLWLVAVDQYASTVGFSVRTEEFSSSLDLLGGISRLSGGGSSDADILYDFIHSQELVEQLDKEADLRGIFSVAWPWDPVFAFDPDGSIEDLVDHWKHKVKIILDSSSGLMTLRVLAFSPDKATGLAQKILERSTEKVNELSQDARADATRYARTEMERAQERLKAAREAMTAFRMRTRMVDPVADLQGQMGILNSLQSQLAESYVELDLLLAGNTSATDPRVVQVEQRIGVIQNRMAEERQKFGENGKGPGGEDYATMVAEFERLSVDREFAEQAYRIALAAYDAALAEAQRKSRYLAVHIRPTEAERAEYPARWTLLGLTGFFLLMAWSIGVLIYYSIRDRR